jgi:hypothetical protein
MKLSTINQVVESILEPVGELPKDGELSKPEQDLYIIATSSVSNNLKGRSNSAGGYKWRYV